MPRHTGLRSHLFAVSLTLIACTNLLHAQAPIRNNATNIVLETVQGARYERVKITRKTSSQITFWHSAGVCTLNTVDLTDESLAALGITNLPVFGFSEAEITPKPTTPQAVCPRCTGYKSITCPTCRGGGFGLDVIDQKPCDKCGGDGSVTRRRPAYEYKGGAGHMKEVVYETAEEDCPTCKGAGTIDTKRRAYCSSCGGHGSMPCPQCSGR